MRFGYVATLAGLLITISTPAAAQQGADRWYAGIGGGVLQIKFQPDYTEIADGERTRFDNRASGAQVQVLGGRRFGATDRLSVALQGSIELNGFEWSLAIPEESAQLSYSLPYAAMVSVLPEVDLGGAFSAGGELGGGIGRVQQLKTSPVDSRYDHDEATALLAAGAGVALRLSPRSDLRLGYRHLRYARSEFDTYDPAGTHIEHVTDAPRSNSLSLVLIVRR